MRNARLVLAAYLGANGVSMLGDAFRGFTLTLWVFQTSHQSGTAATALMVAQFLPSVLSGTFAGVLVDRWPTRRVLLGSDALRAIGAAGLVWCAANSQLAFGLIFVAASAAVGTLGTIAGTTATAKLTDDKHLERVNSVWTVMQQLSFVIGPALAAVCFTRWGPAVAFGIDSASFAFSFVVLGAFLPALARIDAADALTQSGSPDLAKRRSKLWSDLRAGLGYLRANTLARATILAVALRSTSAGINGTMMIFFIVQALHQRPVNLAWLAICNGLTQAAIGGLLITLSSRAQLPRSVRAGAVLMAAGGVVVATAPSMIVLVVGVIITSLGNAPANIGHNTLQQRYVSVAFLGRVRGVQETLLPLCYLLGSTAAGTAVAIVGPRTVLAASAILLIGTLLVTESSILPVMKRSGAVDREVVSETTA